MHFYYFPIFLLINKYYSEPTSIALGLLVDDGAPYSAIGFVELKLLLNQSEEIILDSIPESLGSETFWQYGTAHHSSPARKILGSFTLCLQSYNNRDLLIRHLILDGLSQWVIGKNVTSICDILH